MKNIIMVVMAILILAGCRNPSAPDNNIQTETEKEIDTMWQTPKTDWKAGDRPDQHDFNRIEENAEWLRNKTFAGSPASITATSLPNECQGYNISSDTNLFIYSTGTNIVTHIGTTGRQSGDRITIVNESSVNLILLYDDSDATRPDIEGYALIYDGDHDHYNLIPHGTIELMLINDHWYVLGTGA